MTLSEGEGARVERLIAAARAGSAEAWDSLDKLFRPYLQRISDAEMPAAIRGKVAASDVVQEACTAAGLNFPQFRGTTEGQLRAWLRKILRRKLQQWVRKFTGPEADVRKERPVNDLTQDLLNRLTGDSAESPSKRAVAHELRDGLRQTLAALNEEDRRLIEWHWYQHLAWKDIGERLGNVSADAARQRGMRALLRLKRLLGPSHDSGG